MSEELRRLHRKAEQEGPEISLAFQLTASKIGGWKKQVTFHPSRQFRFDFAFPEEKIAVEVEGGQSVAGGGHHQRSGGYEHDCIKYNEAALLGWMVLRFTTRMVLDGRALRDIERALEIKRRPL